MPSHSSTRRKRFGVLGVTMIVVVVPFCLYYLFFVSSQTDYFSNRNFRVLAAIGEHMNSKSDNLATNLFYVAKKAEDSDKTKIEKARGAEPSEDHPAVHELSDEEKVKNAAKLVPDFANRVQFRRDRALTDKCPSSNQKLSLASSKTNSASPDLTPAEQCSETDSELSAEGSAPVVMTIESEKSSFWLSLEYRSASCPLPGVFSVKSDLSTLFGPFVAPYVIEEMNETKERLFDEVLVAEQETGRVIFEQGPAGLDVVTLDSLLNSKGGKLDVKLADQSSYLADVQIAGADYKLFLQPLRLRVSGGNDKDKQGIRWVICGLTRTDHFRGETFAVSYTVLIIFVFGALLTALSWPLIKLKLMGPKDRLRRVDFGLTLFSATVGTALVTFILLDLHTYLSLNDALDDNIQELSGKIRSNFRDELVRALKQLQDLNAKLETVPENQSAAISELAASKKPADNSATGGASNQTTSSGAISTGSSNPLLTGRPNILTTDYLNWQKAPYPYFNNATWTDPRGQQRIKWTTRPDTTSFVCVSKRQFFQDVRENRTWKLKHDRDVFEYSLELLNSKNTGQNIAVIATPVPNSPWVSNLDTRLISLMGTVLPVGYGFAVIDGSGRVVFHGDEVKNLEEQFFDECGNDRWLRAAVLSRTDRFLDTKYLGRAHRMYVSPLAGTRWTLVAFVDKRIARTINLEVITLSFVLYIIFALLILALVSLVCLPRMIRLFSGRYLPTQGGFSLLWPAPKRAFHYELLIAAYVLIAGIFGVALIVGGVVLGVSCVLLTLAAAGLWCLILRDARGDARAANEKANALSNLYESALGKLRKLETRVIDRLSSRRKKDSSTLYRTRYAIAFTGLLSIVSILPAVALFQIAHRFEMKLMVKHGQVSLAKALEQRTQRVNLQYAAIKIGEQAAQTNDNQQSSPPPDSREEKNKFLQQRLKPSPDKPLDVYDSCFFGTESGDPSHAWDEEQPGLLGLLLPEIRPLYNQSCVESQGLAARASSDGLWSWKQDGDGHIFLGKEKDGRSGDPSVALQSSIPGIVAPHTFAGWIRVVLSMVLVVLLPYGLVRFVARRFFLLDMELPESKNFAGANPSSGSYVLIRSPIVPKGDKWTVERYCVNDLREEKVWPGLTEALKTEPANLPVVLDNFEYRMDDPGANREKLMAIEHLLGSGRRVVVASTVDPLCFSLAKNPGGQAASSNGKVDTSSGPVTLESIQNSAADVKPVAIEGKQNGNVNGNVNGNTPAPVAYLPRTDLHARWTELFTNFATICVSDNSSAELLTNQPELADILNTKKPSNQPDTKAGTLTEKVGVDRATIEEQISEVVEQRRPYHQALWMTFSEGQRCTLIHLAQDGMLSPKNKHLRRLVKRGLVVRDPTLRLMDEAFRRFVISVSSEHDVEAWRRQEGGSAWEMLKTPLLLILVSLALFLFITQKDIYDSTISVMSAVTGGIALLFRLLGMFHGRDKGGSVVQS